MMPDKRLLLYLYSFYLLLFLGVLSFYLFNPFDNECVRGNCKDGFAVYFFHSGIKYEGNWKNGKRHGKGTLTYPDGSKYEGEWKNNKMEGYGVKTYANSNLYKYMGDWRNGKKQGQGTQIYINGEQYAGEWRNGEMHGRGIYVAANGRKISGKRKDGILYGLVTEINPDGRTLIVEWKNGNRNGRGILTYPDGTKIKGEWINNRLVGSAEFYLFRYAEFQEGYIVADLCSKIKEDIRLSLKARGNTTKWLNELLKVPNLYEEFNGKIQDKRLSKEIDALLENTKDIRNKRFSELNNDRQKDILKLNRLLLEHLYPFQTPRS
jgi:hypothetical protein